MAMEKEKGQHLPRSSSHGSSHAPREEGRMEGEGVAREVARHYNEQRERRLDSRKRSKIITLKNYNNWVKSMNFSK